MPKPRYIDMPLPAALKLKFDDGAAKHRDKPADGFTGDPVAELFEEFLDAYHYTVAVEKTGVELPLGWKGQFIQMALILQRLRKPALTPSIG